MGRIDLNNYEAFLLDYIEGNLSEADARELKNFVLIHPELNIDLDQEELPAISLEEDKADFKSDLLKSESDIPGYDLIAYLEGALSDEEKLKLEKELAADPGLAKELEMYRKTVLAKEDFLFEGKASLEKTEDEFLLSSRSLQYIEGLLSADDKVDFEKDLHSNKTLEQEIHLLEKTVLAPDLSVIYPDKPGLKKKARIIALFSYRTVAAMAAAILLLIGLIVLFNKNNSGGKIAPSLAENTNPKNNSSVPSVTDNIPSSVKNNSVAGVKESTVPAVVNVPHEEMKKSPMLADKRTVEQKKSDAKDTAVILKENKQLVKKEEEKNPLPEIIFPEKISNDTALAVVKKENRNVEEAPSKKALAMIPLEEDEEAYAVQPEKKGFWKRAVSVARQANVLGLKAVNGEEKAKGDYVISFAGFSVEKK
jgi:hypothetical protein